MTETELVDYFNEHVFYEWCMLHFSKQRLEKGEPQLVWNAMFAAFNVSARNLYVFLGNREKGNMNVADYRLYCPSFVRGSIDPVRRTLGDLNSQCLHLGKGRTKVAEQKIYLDRIGIVSTWIESNMAKLLKSFNDDFRSKLRPEWVAPIHQQQMMIVLGPTGPSSSALPSIIESGPTSIGQMVPVKITPENDLGGRNRSEERFSGATLGEEQPSIRMGDSLDRLKRHLLEVVPIWDCVGWARAIGIAERDAAAQLRAFREHGQVLVVRDGTNEWYPQFQFDSAGKPLPAIAEVLEVAPEDARGWPLLSWFSASNVFLNGQRPLELLRTDPDAVRHAAIEFYGDSE